MNALIHSHSPHQLQEVAEEITLPAVPSPVPPPIPPRTSGAQTPVKGDSYASQQKCSGNLTQMTDQRRPSSSSSSATSVPHKRTESVQMSHIAAAAMIQQRHAIAGGASLTDSVHSSTADLQMIGLDFLFGTHPQSVKEAKGGENHSGSQPGTSQTGSSDLPKKKEVRKDSFSCGYADG